MADGFNKFSAASTTRWVYAFGGGSTDGDAKMKKLLDGRGASLAEMSSLGLPVPPGLTIITGPASDTTPKASPIRPSCMSRWTRRWSRLRVRPASAFGAQEV